MNNRIALQIQTIWALDADARCIEYRGRWISWGEMRRSALEIDRALTEAGLGRGAPVGVLLRNRPGLIAALLGLLVSDRCIISLNPFQPREGVESDLSQLKLPAVVADEQDLGTQSTIDTLREQGSLGLIVGEDGDLAVRSLTPRSAERAPFAPLPEVALEILTSGTTGAPKRIRISYRTLEDSIIDDASGPERPQPPTALKSMPTVVAAPLMHVSGMFGVLLPLLEGRAVVLLDKFEVESWAAAIEKYQIRFASLPPTPMRMVIDAGIAKQRLSSLVAVRAGTAPLPAQTQREFESIYGIPVLVQYGATEWMGGIAGWTLDEHRQFGAAKLGSVGRARRGVKLRVVDPESGQAVAAEQIGVLEVIPERRLGAVEWTRTTDLASLDADGFLYIHGRTDDTIIRGGFKVMLSHVSEVIAGHAAVAEVAIVGIPDARLGQVPVAAIELKSDMPPPAPGELESFARAHLKPYEVPVAFKIVAALPRTVSMKVIRPEVRELFLPT
jgi:acyl-CoA synthetase (AMP-forming)/AMP-acid ligase II